MKRQELVEATRILAPHVGKKVSVTYESPDGGNSTLKARLEVIANLFLVVGGERIKWEQVQDLFLIVVSEGEVPVSEDRAPQ